MCAICNTYKEAELHILIFYDTFYCLRDTFVIIILPAGFEPLPFLIIWASFCGAVSLLGIPYISDSRLSSNFYSSHIYSNGAIKFL